MPQAVTQSQSIVATSTRPTARTLRPYAFSMLLALLLQFMMGMLTNLFVQIPDSHPGSNSNDYFAGVPVVIGWAIGHGAVALRLHVLFGLSLLLAASIMLGLAIAARLRVWIIVASSGIVGILGAAFNGSSFLIYGHDFSSLLMSLGFMIALCSYSVGLYLTERVTQREVNPASTPALN